MEFHHSLLLIYEILKGCRISLLFYLWRAWTLKKTSMIEVGSHNQRWRQECGGDTYEQCLWARALEVSCSSRTHQVGQGGGWEQELAGIELGMLRTKISWEIKLKRRRKKRRKRRTRRREGGIIIRRRRRRRGGGRGGRRRGGEGGGKREKISTSSEEKRHSPTVKAAFPIMISLNVHFVELTKDKNNSY